MLNKGLERFEENYSEGQIVFCEFEMGDTFYFIKSGSVKLVKIIDGKESIVDILKAGTFFGEMSVIESSPRSASAVAVGKLTVVRFPAENFQDVVLQNSQVLIRLIKTLANRIFTQQQKLKIYLFKSSYTRILACLNSLKVKKKKNEKVHFHVVNSDVEDISKWVGLSVGDCRNELKRLAQRKMIAIHPEGIIILDDNMLKRELALYSSREEVQT